MSSRTLYILCKKSCKTLSWGFCNAKIKWNCLYMFALNGYDSNIFPKGFIIKLLIISVFVLNTNIVSESPTKSLNEWHLIFHLCHMTQKHEELCLERCWVGGGDCFSPHLTLNPIPLCSDGWWLECSVTQFIFRWSLLKYSNRGFIEYKQKLLSSRGAS